MPDSLLDGVEMIVMNYINLYKQLAKRDWYKSTYITQNKTEIKQYKSTYQNIQCENIQSIKVGLDELYSLLSLMCNLVSKGEGIVLTRLIAVEWARNIRIRGLLRATWESLLGQEWLPVTVGWSSWEGAHLSLQALLERVLSVVHAG